MRFFDFSQHYHYFSLTFDMKVVEHRLLDIIWFKFCKKNILGKFAQKFCNYFFLQVDFSFFYPLVWTSSSALNKKNICGVFIFFLFFSYWFKVDVKISFRGERKNTEHKALTGAKTFVWKIFELTFFGENFSEEFYFYCDKTICCRWLSRCQ